jgi:GT2 family glycosyltransferase
MKWIEGSCFVVKREVFKAVGLLDPIYVSFYEEVDFCRRAACRGYITALIPRSRFHHYGGGTWRSTPQLKRLRGIRYDHSHLIFSLTDPRKSQLGNLIWYLTILTVKIAVQAKTFHFMRIWDLIRLQPAIFGEIGALKRKLDKDRALLEHQRLCVKHK